MAKFGCNLELLSIDNYIEYEEWANDPSCDEFTRNHFKENVDNNPEKLEQCKKWLGKTITLQEVEENIEEFEEIMFDGRRILIINGSLE